MLTVGSLFAGIGGFDLGLERAGMQVKWQVEIDPYCLKVLEKHWPHVKRYTDIKTVDGSGVEPVDLVCGGFPCQDLSVAGKRAGIDGERSGLWSEYVRCLRALRPRYVLVENVPGLLANPAMGRVLGDLAESGYDAEWRVISAADMGAPHLRKRVWIVAYTTSDLRGTSGDARCEPFNRRNSLLAYAASLSRHERPLLGINRWSNEAEQVGVGCQTVSITERERCEEQREARAFKTSAIIPDSGWSIEPNVGRVAHGVPSRVDRLKGLGNAVVPQCVEWIGRRILECHLASTQEHD